ncbi:unnamed protein product [Protopolystoma xenopodis]|uniref:Uncharacterized protein n=1 Tax=Protopolystoma xenopodis TaxID=117903 RepID=A0A448X2D8_9PLAT|nr:unnamed protein product [Protopolystoma xenopodis]
MLSAALPNYEKTVLALQTEIDCLQTALDDLRCRIRREISLSKEAKSRTLRDQIANTSSQLMRCTGLIQFCIEMLKEPDAAAFLMGRTEEFL